MVVDAARESICCDIQRAAVDEVAVIPLGTESGFTAMRLGSRDRVNGVVLFRTRRRA